MKFGHICIITSDMEKSIKLFRDVLGFKVIRDTIIPEGPGKDKFFDQTELDSIFHVKGSKSRMVLLSSDERAIMELQQPENPKVQKVPREKLEYGYVGIKELAFNVQNIEEWFNKIKAAGYETQTDHIWSFPGSRSFLFYDHDGNMLQMVEDPAPRKSV
ncbi:MAG: VOC family protein [Dehalococcoidales bacterium]|nr:VOC family protein [Dehalococcoidales bacterium]